MGEEKKINCVLDVRLSFSRRSSNRFDDHTDKLLVLFCVEGHEVFFASYRGRDILFLLFAHFLKGSLDFKCCLIKENIIVSLIVIVYYFIKQSFF